MDEGPATPPTEEGASQASEEARLRPILDGVLAELNAQDPTASSELVERAFETALVAHRGQVRKSGEPYLIHPLRVAGTIARLGLDAPSVAAGLIHDSVEDSDLTVFDVTQTFGREIALLVDGVTKLGKLPYLSRKEQAAESFRKMLLAMSQDIRVLIVKLADRLDNMRSLEHMPSSKQLRIARETMDIYVPLAGRLGIEWMRAELQDLSFRYLEPGAYELVSGRIDELMKRDPDFVSRRVTRLREVFGPVDDVAQKSFHAWEMRRFGAVEVRASLRSAFSMHRLLEESGQELTQPADVVTYQIITQDRLACYAALGQLHDALKLIPGSVRDFIALPKPNHYQGLHTLVVDVHGVRMDIQIRTEHMDQVAERGIVVSLVGDDDAPESKELRLAWLRQLMDWQDEVADPHEFIESVKADLYSNEVYVYTPDGDMLTFPHGATPIDFAFAIHSDVGQHCSGARVNGHIVPLGYRLHQGDSVEILTNPAVEPRRGWLEICRTARARARVKHFLRGRERARNLAAGQTLLAQHFAEDEDVEARLREHEDLAKLLDEFGIGQERGADGLIEEIGRGSISPAVLAARMTGGHVESSDAGIWARVIRRVAGRSGKQDSGVLKDGTVTRPIVLGARELRIGDGIAALGSCCEPIPGDPIVGFVVGGRGLVVHLERCPQVNDQIESRRVYVVWNPDLEMTRPVTIEVKTSNTVGLLAEMSRVFSEHQADIKQANCRASKDLKRATNTFHASVRNLEQLEGLMVGLRGIRGVQVVQRALAANLDDAEVSSGSSSES
jgi:GTP pyrophosphokinase